MPSVCVGHSRNVALETEAATFREINKKPPPKREGALKRALLPSTQLFEGHARSGSGCHPIEAVL
jgi:hypothetical protein